MKFRAWRIVVSCVIALSGLGSASAAQPRDAAAEQRNLERVQGAFDRWASGGGFFDQLPAPDARWVVHGSGPLAKAYAGRETYVREFVRPFAQRLKAPVAPTLRRLVAQDDLVVAIWDGAATARDDVPYRNNYVWVFRFQGDKAVEIEIFLDLETYQGVVSRVPPQP